MDSGIRRLSKTFPGTNGQADPNTNLQAEKSLKAPGSLTEQVLVGMLNDVFSSCVFRSVPRIETDPIRLELTNSNSQTYYMISLRWSRANIDIQAISHTFSVFEKWTTLSQDDTRKYGHKGSLISLGLFTSLKLCLKEPCDAAKIPISIVKNYINREINKGGYWAYMCCPVFLSDKHSMRKMAARLEKEEEDEEALAEMRKLQEDQRDRLAKLVKLSSEQLEVITPSTILALLWSIYYTNAHRRLHVLCGVLCNEFLNNHANDLQSLVYVYYLSQRMGLIANARLEEMLVAKFNNVTALERLSAQDAVVLVNVLGFSDAGALLAQKVATMLHHHVEDLGKESAVYLVTGLAKLNFNFHHNDLFTKKLLSRILGVYDDIDSSELLEVLFSTLSIMAFDVVGYFNEFISKTLTRLHRLTVNEIGRIGCCYATAVNTSEILGAMGGLAGDKRAKFGPADAGAAQQEPGGPAPLQTSAHRLAALKQVLQGRASNESRHIYHCLEHHFRLSALNYSCMELDLLAVIHEAVVYASGFHFSEELSKKGFRYNKAWMHSFSLNTPLSHSAKVTRKVNVKALEAQANNPAYSNSYKMFFLNLIDDCCNHTALFDQTLIDQVVFSLLTMRIDLSPINEAMLVSKGEIVKNPGGIIQIKIIEHLEDMLKQYSMAREIMSWSRVKQGMDGSVVISGVEIDESSIYLLSRDKRRLTNAPVVVPVVPKQPQHVGRGVKPTTIVSGGGITPVAASAPNTGVAATETAQTQAQAQAVSATLASAVATAHVVTTPNTSVTPTVVPTLSVPPVTPASVELPNVAAAATPPATSNITALTATETDPSGPAVGTSSAIDHNIALNGATPGATPNATAAAAAPSATTASADAKTTNLTDNSHASLENMVKMMMGLPETAELEGNPILELIKSYRTNGSNAAVENTPRDGVEPASGNAKAEEPASQSGSRNAMFLNSRASNVSTSKEFEKPNRTRRTQPFGIKGRKSIEKLKDKKKKNKNDGKKYELFYRVKTLKKVKMELEKRELQIIYKYVKIK